MGKYFFLCTVFKIVLDKFGIIYLTLIFIHISIPFDNDHPVNHCPVCPAAFCRMAKNPLKFLGLQKTFVWFSSYAAFCSSWHLQLFVTLSTSLSFKCPLHNCFSNGFVFFQSILQSISNAFLSIIIHMSFCQHSGSKSFSFMICDWKIFFNLYIFCRVRIIWPSFFLLFSSILLHTEFRDFIYFWHNFNKVVLLCS